MGGSSGEDIWSDIADPLSSIQRNRAAQEQTNALKGREIQQNIAAIQQKEQRSEQLERVVSSATAEQAARGLSLGSGSFQAIQSTSFNDFARDERTINLNTKLQDDAINQQISNINHIKNAENWETIFAKGVQVAGTYFGLKSAAKKPGGGQSPTSGKSSLGGYGTDSSNSLENAFDSSSDKDFPDAFSYTPEEEEKF